MSVPARSVPAPQAPAPAPRRPRRAAPERTERTEPRRTPARPRRGLPAIDPPTPAGARRARARRRFHPVFWALTAALLTAIVVALVSVSALVVETGFNVDRTEARIARLAEDGERLRRDVAEMSAPGRIAHLAERKGLVMPETPVVVLQVPGGAGEDAGGSAG